MATNQQITIDKEQQSQERHVDLIERRVTLQSSQEMAKYGTQDSMGRQEGHFGLERRYHTKATGTGI
jgi:hypothetical protein